MQYRRDPKNGKNLSVLGLGCMRFPSSAGRIDIDTSEKLIVDAVDNGINYLDTAYVYNGSEAALGEIFSRNPGLRDKVNVATKLPLPRCKSQEDFDRYLNASLERMGTDHVEYYLMHNITSLNAWNRLQELGIEEWIAKQKTDGKISQIGFSYHGPEGEFIDTLDSYDWDFCQIQYNYMNEHYQAGTAGLEAAAERGIPVIVMEPLLGGKLASELPPASKMVLEESGISDDPVQLALRWVWNHPEVTVVLSGMNAESQLSQNIEIAEDATPGSFTESEMIAVEIAKEEVAKNYKVPCTGCGYCLPCPVGINIPVCFASYNASFVHGRIQGIMQYVTASGAMSGDPHYASDCVQCGKCVEKCPQHINIPEDLVSVKRRLQVPGMPAILRFGTRLISR